MDIIMYSVIWFQFSNQRLTLLHVKTPDAHFLYMGGPELRQNLLLNKYSAFIYLQPEWQEHSH